MAAGECHLLGLPNDVLMRVLVASGAAELHAAKCWGSEERKFIDAGIIAGLERARRQPLQVVWVRGRFLGLQTAIAEGLLEPGCDLKLMLHTANNEAVSGCLVHEALRGVGDAEAADMIADAPPSDRAEEWLQNALVSDRRDVIELALRLGQHAPTAGLVFETLRRGAQDDDEALVEMALRRGAQVSALLAHGALNDDAACIRCARRHGADARTLNEQDDLWPLGIAVCYGYFDAVRALHDATAPFDEPGYVEIEDDDGDETWIFDLPLGLAVADEAMTRLLLQLGVDVNGVCRSGSALHAAVTRGVIPVLELLLESGADYRAVDERGRTPLHVGVQADAQPKVVRLLQRGADARAADNEGGTPLHGARCAQCATALIEYGADVGARDRSRNTPLHYAAMIGATDVAAILLEAGADANAHDRDENEPIELGLRSIHMVELFFAHRVRIRAVAWKIVVQASFWRILERLLQARHDDAVLLEAIEDAGLVDDAAALLHRNEPRFRGRHDPNPDDGAGYDAARCLRLLLDAGVAPVNGPRVLRQAVCAGADDAVCRLLHYGRHFVDVGALATRTQLDIFDDFLDHEFDVVGAPLLFIAASSNSYKRDGLARCMRLLCDEQLFDLDAFFRSFHAVCERGCDERLRVLLDMKEFATCCADKPDEHGRTPLLKTVRCGEMNLSCATTLFTASLFLLFLLTIAGGMHSIDRRDLHAPSSRGGRQPARCSRRWVHADSCRRAAWACDISAPPARSWRDARRTHSRRLHAGQSCCVRGGRASLVDWQDQRDDTVSVRRRCFHACGA